MNDYEDELLGGTLPELTPEQLEALRAEQESTQAILNQFAPEVPTQSQAPQPGATAPAAADPQMQPELSGPFDPSKDFAFYEAQGMTRKEWNRLQLSGGAGGELEAFATDPRGAAEAALALPTGMLDAGLDALNLIPNVDIPKIPKFESDITQSIREISSIVLPTVMLGGAGTAAIAGKVGQLDKASKVGKLLADPLVKQLGNMAFTAGTGAAVDFAVEINQQDDNLAGTLRKSWPRWFGWVPENIATLDGDSPDVKRAKNVTEGAYLGVGMDLLLGLNKLFRNVAGFQKGAPIPKTEKAGEYFKKNIELEGDVEDVVEASAAKRSDSLDEVGNYNVSRKTTFTEDITTGQVYGELDESDSIFGYHDLYGYQEQGVRSVDDMGIVGASIDAARIAGDFDTVYGRIGNSISEGALKFSLEGIENQQTIQRGLADVLTAADEYGYRTASGTEIGSEQIKDAGERLAATFYEMNVDQLRNALVDYQRVNTTTSVPVLSDTAYKGVVGAMKKYMDDFVNLDYMKAQAYVGTSFGGQISDMAQGMRLTEGTPAIERAQEQILDRIEFLMVQKNMTSYSNNRFKGMFEMFNTLSRSDVDTLSAKEAKRIEQTIKGESDRTAAALAKIKEEASSTVNNLREIAREQPEMLQPLMLAYELTDGNVDTITKLNNYLKQSTGILNKAFIDLQPEIPSVVLKGFYSNLYNSTLSAFATPIKAGLSAGAQLIEKPIRTMAGGLMNGDMATVRRGWYQYSAFGEALQGSFDYMKQVFKRSGMDPEVIATREDYGIPSRQLQLINSFAEARASRGDFGPQVFAEMVNNMHELAQHPWLRFGNRSMQALDGFTQSMVAHSEARGLAFDQITKGGLLEFDGTRAGAVYKKVYDKMFDNTGLITNSAVEATAGEIALNLDNKATNAVSSLIRMAPVLKPFLLFTKTPLNELALSASYNPVGLFVKDMNAFRAPFEDMPYQEVEQLFASRGIEVSPDSIRAKYNELRADITGRKALGATMVTGAVGLALNDNITGNGLYDKQKQALRRDADWKPRSIRLPGGQWVSYDNLGPITTWLSLTADIVDNFDSLASNEIGEQLRKLGFVVSSAITDKTALAGLEPFMDILSGNAGAITKWSSSFLTSAVVPGSSQLAEISRLMDPGLKEVETSLFDMMRNRNPISKGQLPVKYDWIDGGEVGVPDTFMARVWNTYMPWKVNGKISPEKQFLMDIEYDARPTLRTDGKGTELTKEHRSEITDIMGRDGLFKAGIQRVMQQVPGGAEGFRKRYMEAVGQGLTPDLSEFENIHIQLDRELRYAMNMAIANSPSYSDITRKRYVQEVTGSYLRSSNQAEAKRFLDYMEQQYSK